MNKSRVSGSRFAGFDLFKPESWGPVADVANVVADGLGAAAKTDIGQTIMGAMTLLAVGPLSAYIGPLASAVVALPGVAKGDDFAHAYVDQWRKHIQAAAQLLGPEAAAGVGNAIASAAPAISQIVNQGTDLINSVKLPISIDDVSNLIAQTGLSGTIDAATGKVRDDVSVWALSQAKGILPPANMITDFVTGAVSVPVTSKESIALGIPLALPANIQGYGAGSKVYPLQSATMSILNNVLEWLKQSPKQTLLIKGWADQSEANPGKLSQDRAIYVAQWLYNHAISAERVKVIGLGPTNDVNLGFATLGAKRVDFAPYDGSYPGAFSPASPPKPIGYDPNSKNYPLSSQTMSILNDALEWLKQNPTMTMLIEGHTDSTESPSIGMVRAQGVANWLMNKAIKPNRLRIAAVGFNPNLILKNPRSVLFKVDEGKIPSYPPAPLPVPATARPSPTIPTGRTVSHYVPLQAKGFSATPPWWQKLLHALGFK